MGSRAQTKPLREPKLWQGLVAGVVSGLVASWVMNQFQATLQRRAEGEERGHGAQSMQHGSPSHGVGQVLRERKLEEAEDDATMRLAKMAADHKLTKAEKEAAGTAIHYAFGASTGAVYGAAAEYLPVVTSGMGLPFGTFVWVTADEGMVPLLGLSKLPTEYPPTTHAYALASHLVYGFTAELARRAVRSVL